MSKVWVSVDVDDADEGDTTASPVLHMERTHARDVEAAGRANTEERGKGGDSLNAQAVDGMRRRRTTKDNVAVEEVRQNPSAGMKRPQLKKMDTVLTGIVGMPSSEIREAAKCFTMAIDQAIALASATSRVDSLLDNANPSNSG